MNPLRGLYQNLTLSLATYTKKVCIEKIYQSLIYQKDVFTNQRKFFLDSKSWDIHSLLLSWRFLIPLICIKSNAKATLWLSRKNHGQSFMCLT